MRIGESPAETLDDVAGGAIVGERRQSIASTSGGKVDDESRALGRVYVPDPRDRKYDLASYLREETGAGLLMPIRSGEPVTLTPRAKSAIGGHVATGSPTKTRAANADDERTLDLRKRPWNTAPIMDQENRPHCVAYAWLQFLLSAPIMQPPGGMNVERQAGRIVGVNHAEARQWTSEGYRWMQDNDYWPGNAYDGTSVRAGADYLRKQGHITEYRWTWTVDVAIAWLRSKKGGTLVGGFDWWQGFNRPDAQGYVDATGQWLGGHAFLVYWFSTELDAFFCHNQWGSRWGIGADGGTFLIRRPLMRYLLEGLNGELCAATQVK